MNWKGGSEKVSEVELANRSRGADLTTRSLLHVFIQLHYFTEHLFISAARETAYECVHENENSPEHALAPMDSDVVPESFPGG